MSLSGRSVLVTGAGGFIGSHLAERLVELGATTRALCEYNSAGSHGWLDESQLAADMDIVLGDVRDRDSVAAATRDVEMVFHLAALIAIPYSYEAPLSYIRTNVEGTANVLQASLAAGVDLVVHTSTSEVYGTAQRVPIDEAHPLQAQSPYAASKIAADKLAESFHLSFGLPVATLRPFNTFGPRQSARAVIPTIATQLLSGKEVRLGNVEPTRDFTFVSDTAEAFVRIASTPEAVGRVVNAGSGEEISIGSLAALIAEVVGREASVSFDADRARPRGSEVERLCADASLARSLIGWEPTRTLRDGLAETVGWLEGNLHRYRADTYTV